MEYIFHYQVWTCGNSLHHYYHLQMMMQQCTTTLPLMCHVFLLTSTSSRSRLLIGTSSINSRSRCQENRMWWVSLLVEVPVGSLPQNKNKCDEVVKIMTNLHQYIPTVKYVEDCFIPSTGVTWSFIIAVSGLMTTTMEPSAVAPPVASSLSIHNG